MIASIVQFDSDRVSQGDSEALTQALNRNPADRVDQWEQGRAFLSCHQQWITPESRAEQLPFFDERHGLAITADAILDNRLELCQRLGMDPGMLDKTTDSEIILMAHLKWGEDAPKYLVGDFAYLVWDSGHHTLFGARDLLGSRNLYYSRNSQRIAFCSIILPLLAMPGAQRALSEVWLADFLAIPSMVDSIDPSATAYHHIKQLPPGYRIKVTGTDVHTESFGTLIPEGELRYRSDEDYLEAFKEVFEDAVVSRARSYRGVGTALSGGLDSTSVASIAAPLLRKQGKSLHGYSMVPELGFTDWTPKNEMADETPFVQETIDFVGNIRENYLTASGKSPWTEVDALLDIFESPYKNFEGTFRIHDIYRQAAQDDVGVFLTGARGNYTISWGSAIDFYALLLKQMKWIRFYRELHVFRKQTKVGMKRILPVIGRQAFPSLQQEEEEPEMPSLIHPAFARRTDVLGRLRGYEVGLEPARNNVLEERQRYFTNLPVLNLQGTSGAKLSSRYKVWERDPTADARLVRFCLSVPYEQYVRGGIGRSLIRRATEGKLPDRVRLNQRIRGAQGVDWVYRMLPHWPSFVEEIRQICRDDTFDGILNLEGIQRAMERIGPTPRPELAVDPHMKLLMRSVIIYRFLKRVS
ncbi:asparagine synthase [Paenibacillus methanolicus]|nr:asparagine synthase [Paenibacillus methanolicus]